MKEVIPQLLLKRVAELLLDRVREVPQRSQEDTVGYNIDSDLLHNILYKHTMTSWVLEIRLNLLQCALCVELMY